MMKELYIQDLEVEVTNIIEDIESIYDIINTKDSFTFEEVEDIACASTYIIETLDMLYDEDVIHEHAYEAWSNITNNIIIWTRQFLGGRW